MKRLKELSLVLLLAVFVSTIISCSDDDLSPNVPPTPSEVLSSTAWETTGAKNQKGESVALTNSNVSNFVGFAYFKNNGTFTMFNLDDSPKMKGDWSIEVAADGKMSRTIIAKNDAGATLFTRVVDITVLTSKEFTYRIYPSANDLSVYYDIIHTPTTHVEPKK